MTFENKNTNKTLTIITSTILLFTLAFLVDQVQISGTVNSFTEVYAQSLPTINPGDILVVLDGIDSSERIVIVDPITGLQTFLVELIELPTDIKVDSAGDLITTNDNGVSRVDLITGVETEIANAGDAFLDSPIGLDLNAAGDIIVIDVDGIVVKIDPVSGLETLITSELTLAESSAIAVEPSGDIIVLNVEDLFRINPTSGITTLLSSGVPAEKIVINDAGDIFAGGSEVVKIDPTTGIATVIASGFDIITGIGVESDGNIIVVETGGITTIHRVNPVTGVQAIVSSGDLLTGTEALTLTVFPSLQIDPDADDDGIFDEVDVQPSTFSDDFSDIGLGGTTSGTITTRGDQTLTITEEANPDGVRIKADISGGPTQATVDACSGISTINFDAGDEVVVTCSSVTIKVLNGQVEVTYSAKGTTANTTISQANELTFEPETFTFTAPTTNTETVIISVNGEDTSVEPGSTVSIPLQVARPDSDPTVRWVNGIGEEPCTDLNSFNCVDEVIRDNNDYIQTIGLGKKNSDKQFYTLSDITDPMTSSGHVLRYTITEADVGVNPVELDVILRQGQTVIASFHHENLPTGFTLIEQTLTAAQADSITVYSDLELTLDGNCDNTCKNSPGNREKIQVSWIEFAIMATS